MTNNVLRVQIIIAKLELVTEQLAHITTLITRR